MEIITNTAQFHLERETAVAIGKFDGIHIGHRRLLDEILARKREGLLACVFTFDPAPAVFFGFSDGKELSVKEEKRLLFERMGVDILIEFPLTKETAAMPPEEFVSSILSEQMNMRFLAAGTDLSFGAGGAGNVDTLKKLSPELGFEIKIIDKVCVDGKVVSSTYVRQQIEAGNMQLAEQLLGMPYPIWGRVTGGRRIGRTLGFPTMNLVPEETKLLPPKGVYFSKVRLDGKLYRAISNVGTKPTIDENLGFTVETYLYDYEADAYGKDIEVYLLEFRRPERQFADLEALKAQLQEDILAGSTYGKGIVT